MRCAVLARCRQERANAANGGALLPQRELRKVRACVGLPGARARPGRHKLGEQSLQRFDRLEVLLALGVGQLDALLERCCESLQTSTEDHQPLGGDFVPRIAVAPLKSTARAPDSVESLAVLGERRVTGQDRSAEQVDEILEEISDQGGQAVRGRRQAGDPNGPDLLAHVLPTDLWGACQRVGA